MPEISIVPFLSPLDFSALFGQSQSAEGSLGWFKALIATTLGPDEEGMFAIAQDSDGAVRAAMPLARSLKDQSLRALTAPYTTLYAPGFPDPHWSRLLGIGARVYVKNKLCLDALDLEDCGVSAFVEGLAHSGLSMATYKHFISRFETIANFEEYWSARPPRLIETVRRKFAQIKRNTPAEFCCHNKTHDAANALADYEAIYAASWKKPEPHPAFMSAMVAELSRDGYIRLGTLTLSSQVVAAQIWLVKGQCATIFKLAHREEAKSLSPGTLLTYWMTAHLCNDEGVRQIDFGRGDDGYKVDWLRLSRPRHGIVAANGRSLSGLKTIVRDILPTRLSALGKRIAKG